MPRVSYNIPVPLGCSVVMVVWGLSVVGRTVGTAAGITGSVLMIAQRISQIRIARRWGMCSDVQGWLRVGIPCVVAWSTCLVVREAIADGDPGYQLLLPNRQSSWAARNGSRVARDGRRDRGGAGIGRRSRSSAQESRGVGGAWWVRARLGPVLGMRLVR
jgi:hypothetical protein